MLWYQVPIARPTRLCISTRTTGKAQAHAGMTANGARYGKGTCGNIRYVSDTISKDESLLPPWYTTSNLSEMAAKGMTLIT